MPDLHPTGRPVIQALGCKSMRVRITSMSADMKMAELGDGAGDEAIRSFLGFPWAGALHQAGSELLVVPAGSLDSKVDIRPN